MQHLALKMAALSERESRKLFTDSLLSVEVSNSYTLDEFKEFFPRKYRDHQDVKVLYDAYQTKRKQIRDSVLMNIRLHCKQREQRQDGEVTDSKYEDDIAALDAKEQMLQEEIDAMQQDTEQVQEKIGSCADNLEKKNVFSWLQKADFNVGKHKDNRISRNRSDR